MDMELKSRIGDWIELRGYKKKWVAQQLGINQNVLSRWIHNKSYPGLVKAFALADLLGCNVDDLYTRNP